MCACKIQTSQEQTSPLYQHFGIVFDVTRQLNEYTATPAVDSLGLDTPKIQQLTLTLRCQTHYTTVHGVMKALICMHGTVPHTGSPARLHGSSA
jgi:hypothetical protein